MDRFSAQGLTGLKARCWLRLGLSLRLQALLRAVFGQNPSPHGRRTKVPIFLLALDHGSLPSPRCLLQILAMWLP